MIYPSFFGKKQFLFLILIVAFFSLPEMMNGQDHLILFTQSSDPISSEEKAALATLAADLKIEFKEHAIDQSAPEEVCLTP